MFAFPPEAVKDGFVAAGLGAHSSRTIMLAELRRLLECCGPPASLEVYRRAIIEENVLMKQTEATRKESLRRLRELYGLDERLLIFRALRELWGQEPSAQPLLALFCALGRDPALRMTAQVILDAQPGAPVNAEMISLAVQEQAPSRLNAMTLANIGRHAASSWTQSGHLSGRTQKVRVQVQAGVTATAYALLLGYLCGERGGRLFETLWARLLDAPVYTLQAYARQAARQGWLEYRQAGDVTEITVRHFRG